MAAKTSSWLTPSTVAALCVIGFALMAVVVSGIFSADVHGSILSVTDSFVRATGGR